PVTNLVSPMVVQPNQQFTLDATETTDPNGDALRFRWEQSSGEPVLDPEDAGTGVRTVVAPERPQALVFRAYASDDRLESAATEVTVIVRIPDGATQLDLGPGVDLRSRPGRPVILDAQSVSDTQLPGASYEWIQTRGPEVELTISENGTATFEAPSRETFAFALSVSDANIVSAPAVSTVTVVGPEDNLRPSVFLCTSLEQPEPGQIVTLAARIFDPEGDALEEPEWSGPDSVEFLDATASSGAQTCAGDAPSVHGGPQESSAVTSVTFEMPALEETVEFELESCDASNACATATVRFVTD
ncbi:MAG: hypothetical protein AAF658_09120, partial [Myxococcota bacterium]